MQVTTAMNKASNISAIHHTNLNDNVLSKNDIEIRLMHGTIYLIFYSAPSYSVAIRVPKSKGIRISTDDCGNSQSIQIILHLAKLEWYRTYGKIVDQKSKDEQLP
jgi:hypothetical protein